MSSAPPQHHIGGAAAEVAASSSSSASGASLLHQGRLVGTSAGPTSLAAPTSAAFYHAYSQFPLTSSSQPYHFASNATSLSQSATPATSGNDTAMLMQQLQQSLATSALPSTTTNGTPATSQQQALLMDELLLKHAAAALAAQKLDSNNTSTSGGAIPVPMTTTSHSPFQPSMLSSSLPASMMMEQRQPSTTPTPNIPMDIKPAVTPAKSETPSSLNREEQQSTGKTTSICCVCNDEASGRHYGSVTCFGCKGFFRRTVRAGKVYQCRYQENCQIDKVGRNVCRSCRFRKCLEAGMEPDAIRPDRDKTGRQKNPRRSGNSISSSRSFNASGGGAIADADLMLLEGRMSRASPNLDAQSSVSSPPSDEDHLCYAPAHQQTRSENLRSYCESSAPSALARQQKNLIVETLAQIEQICADLLDDPKMSPSSEADRCSDEDQDAAAAVNSLADVLTRTSLLARRTPLDYSGRLALRDPASYSAALRRLVVMAIDYANTLKPIADMEPGEKIVLIRSFIAPFILLTTAYRSANEGRADQILLPNGYYIDAATPLSAFRDELDASAPRTPAAAWLETRINATRASIIDRLNVTIERLGLSEAEFVCLKAILALDPNVPQLSEASAQKLALARDSVQNALYVQLSETCAADQEAVTRFGRLLMLLTNVTKTGAHFSNIMQMGRELQPDVDSLMLELFAL